MRRNRPPVCLVVLPKVGGELGKRGRDATRRVSSLPHEALLVVLVRATRVAGDDVHDAGENLGGDRVTLSDARQSLFRPHLVFSIGPVRTHPRGGVFLRRTRTKRRCELSIAPQAAGTPPPGPRRESVQSEIHWETFIILSETELMVSRLDRSIS